MENVLDHKVIATFPTFYEGWEFDNTGFVIETSGGVRSIVLTSHNSTSLGFSSDNENDLLRWIQKFEDWKQECVKALEIFRKGKEQ
jgi:hypothetical protein